MEEKWLPNLTLQLRVITIILLYLMESGRQNQGEDIFQKETDWSLKAGDSSKLNTSADGGRLSLGPDNYGQLFIDPKRRRTEEPILIGLKDTEYDMALNVTANEQTNQKNLNEAGPGNQARLAL